MWLATKTPLTLQEAGKTALMQRQHLRGCLMPQTREYKHTCRCAAAVGAGGPGQRRLEGGKQVVQAVGDDDVVVHCHQHGHHDHREAHTCQTTLASSQKLQETTSSTDVRWRWSTVVCSLPCIIGTALHTLMEPWLQNWPMAVSNANKGIPQKTNIRKQGMRKTPEKKKAVNPGSSAFEQERSLRPLTSTVTVGQPRELPDVSQPDGEADHGEHVLRPAGPMEALRDPAAIITTSFLFRGDPNQAQGLHRTF